VFHHEMITDPDEERRFDCLYAELFDVVHQSLRMLTNVQREWCKKSFATGDDVHLTSVSLAFEFAEAIDGVSLLIRAGSARNCPSLLRTALELHLGLKYLLETKDGYRCRSLSYEYFTIQQRLNWRRKCDPDDPHGQQLRKELDGHPHAGVFDAPDAEVKKAAQFYRERLDSHRYSDVRAELERMKAGKRKCDDWFGLWDGPRSVRDLAYRLRDGVMYEVLYRQWSGPIHGSTAIERMTATHSGLADCDPLRSPKGIIDVTRHAFNLCNATAFHLTDKLVPHIRQDVESHFQALVHPKLDVLEKASKVFRD
jgi:hypothetical protein